MKRISYLLISVLTVLLCCQCSGSGSNEKEQPVVIGGGLKSFDVTADDVYDLTFSFLTSDSVAANEAEKMVKFSMQVTPAWEHAPNGCEHLVKIKVKPSGSSTLNMITQQNQPIAKVNLPAADRFCLVSQNYKSDHIELTFNKRLDDKQKVDGLIYLSDRESTVTIEGNKARLYATFKTDEKVQVQVSGKLRSKSGMTYGNIEEAPIPAVVITSDKPKVELVGDGTIIPQQGRVLIPFRSVNMRGVRVALFKVFSNTMHQFLLQGDYNYTSNFIYTARPIAATTFYMEDSGENLSEWHTFAIDLTDQVKLEPGALYRVELSLDARLSAWPCDTLPKATREEIAAADAEVMQKLVDKFDNSDYYYNGWAYDSYTWFSGYYEARQDPSTRYYYEDRTVGKNMLATNIGLSAMKGSDNSITVTALHLASAEPMSGVKVSVYSKQQQLIGTGTTNGKGVAQIAYDSRGGQPAMVSAKLGDDVSYLKVDNGQSLSTSTFDVSGNVVERGLKGYIYGERGVWRPGDTLHLGFILNDRAHRLPAGHPVNFSLVNPLGQVAVRNTVTQGVMGIYTFNVPTSADAPTGIWTARIEVGGVNFHKNVRVEAIKPNRLKIDLSLPEGTLGCGKNEAKLHTEWLNGSKAGGLRYDVTATLVKSTTKFKQWPGYQFDNPQCDFETTDQQLCHGKVDVVGDAPLQMNLTGVKSAPGMLRASLVTRVYEPSGEFSTDVCQVQVAPFASFAGVKAPATNKYDRHDTDHNYTYQVVNVDKDGNLKRAGDALKVKVYKVSYYWWWRSLRGDMAAFTSSSINRPVKELTAELDSEGKGSFNLNMSRNNWGTYFITVEDETSGHIAGLIDYFDWPEMTSRRDEEGGDEATVLSITTDKKEYAPGEKMQVSFPSDAESHAIVSLSNGSKVLQMDSYECQAERTTITLNVTEEMSPNIYVGVQLVQPYSQTMNDMPIRMYGVIPVSVTDPKSKLAPAVTCADEFTPEAKCQVTVSEKNGRPMGYTLAVVDEGLLDLTRFKTPNAWNQFNAREALGVRFWDLYSHVNGAYGGRIEQMFSIGGDEALNNGPKAIVNRFAPMVYFAGPFELKKGEKRTHKIDVPNYNGRVRVMVVAGDGSAYGNAEKSVMVRKPLMMIGTMPRQIGVGDEMEVSATLFATKKLGDVKVNISTKNLQVVGEKSQTVTFNEEGDQTVRFRIKAGEQGGTGLVTIKAEGGGCNADYSTEITVRTVGPPLKSPSFFTLTKDNQIDQQFKAPGNTSYEMKLEVSATAPLSLRSRVDELIVYPHGCVEQTTSKAFAQLLMGQFAQLTEAQKSEVESNVKYCIERYSGYQTQDGGLGYWPGDRIASEWGSAYAALFLHEASAKGYYVPEELKSKLTQYLTTTANNWVGGKDAFTAAFQLYVLSTMGKPQTGAMNRMREHADEFSPATVYMLMAAYHQAAMPLKFEIGNAREYGHYWFPSGVAKLLGLMNEDSEARATAANEVRARLADGTWLSTSENALSIYSLAKFYKLQKIGDGLKFAATLDGKKLADVDSRQYLWQHTEQLSEKDCRLQLKNNSDATLYAQVVMCGEAVQCPVEAESNGLELTLTYTTDNGLQLNPSQLTQSATFKAKLRVRNLEGKAIDNVAITHILPAGWEVLKAEPSGNINYQDLRDDRVLSYVDHLSAYDTVTIQLVLSATYAGSYYLPSVHAEAMYDNTISGCTASGSCVVK